MENHKLGTSNREISTTNRSANQTRVERTVARWSSILILLGMLCLGVGFAQAEDDAALPVKNLEQADGQIHWPDEMTPKKADAFVHNQIFIKAPASVIWSNLVKAKDWPKWYSNSSDVKITEGSELGPKTQFTWSTLNFPIASRIDEFVPNERISWYGDGPGIRAYHTWLIVSKGDGCEVTTEETQVGPSAIKFNLAQPRAMYDAHDWWLSALKVRSENAVKD
jgi:Polyketide cyclase / dehydrase and lipid transport